eukprot:GHRR01032806.1.p2 GENE.GHRR01032806.1~~GHRR01032806.1.p2  ORF type:complete len:164 (+),score=36.26 GHRR01032806.1:132-623(+)
MGDSAGSQGPDTRRKYSREQLLELGKQRGCTVLPKDINMNVIRELEELTFFDATLKPDWSKDRGPGHGRLDFLRPGGGFGAGPIRSRLVADGSLPEELPPPRPDLLGPGRSSDALDIHRSASWRPSDGAAGHTPPDRLGERWGNGPATPVSKHANRKSLGAAL